MDFREFQEAAVEHEKDCSAVALAERNGAMRVVWCRCGCGLDRGGDAVLVQSDRLLDLPNQTAVQRTTVHGENFQLLVLDGASVVGCAASNTIRCSL